MTRRGSATSRAPPLTAFGTDCGAQWATGAGMEEELMRYRQRQCLKGLLLCFLFRWLSQFGFTFNAPP